MTKPFLPPIMNPFALVDPYTFPLQVAHFSAKALRICRWFWLEGRTPCTLTCFSRWILLGYSSPGNPTFNSWFIAVLSSLDAIVFKYCYRHHHVRIYESQLLPVLVFLIVPAEETPDNITRWYPVTSSLWQRSPRADFWLDSWLYKSKHHNCVLLKCPGQLTHVLPPGDQSRATPERPRPLDSHSHASFHDSSGLA